MTQNNAPVPCQRVTVNSTNYIMFDITPNAPAAVIAKLAAPVLDPPVVTNRTGLNIRLRGQTGGRYALSASDDLRNWTAVQTNTLSDTAGFFTATISEAAKFYRAECLQ